MKRNIINKFVIGWRERAGLPELGIDDIKVKVDTGARTSALHAFNIAPARDKGRDWIRFDIHPIQRDDTTVVTCTCHAHDYRWVMNSGGKREKRYVIETPIRLGDHEWPIEITLTERDQMGFRMLLGRTALRGRFAIDPSKSFQAKRAVRISPIRAEPSLVSADGLSPQSDEEE